MLAASMLALAACAPRTTVPTTTPPPPRETVPEKPPESPKPGEVYRIAVLAPLTGTNAPVGLSLANAANLAVSDTGKTGIRITSYDTALLGAKGAADKALSEGAQLILGPLLSGDVGQVRDAAAARNITLLTFSNDAALAGGNVYVLGFQPAQSVARVVTYAKEQGRRNFAALVPNGIYGQRTSVAFTRAVNAGEGRIVAMTSFARQRDALPAAARKVTDYDSRLKKAGGAVKRPDGTVAPVTSSIDPIAFDALLVADSGAIAGGFAPLLARYGASPNSYLLMGTELWSTETGLRNVASLRGAVFAAVPDDRFQAMASRYRARFNAAPSRLASLAYDATLLAVSVAGNSWKVDQPFPANILSDAKGFAGIDGIFRFQNNIAERGMEVRQVGPGGFAPVSPAPSGF